jgi:hypothetical protein
MIKLILILAFYSIINLSLEAQVNMQVSEIIVSRLKQGSNEKKITNGKDTTTTRITETSFIDTPFLEALILIENCSDSIITFDPNEDSIVTVCYKIDNIVVKKEINNYFVKIDNDSIFILEPINLRPNKKLFITCKDYLFSNNVIQLNKNNKDNTINVLRILPTMKFIVKSQNKGEIINYGVFDIKIQERPTGSMEFYIPEGYWILNE